ncbi:MAG: N-glycosylase/DNA lyase [Candidatus Omnitrophota bacterium]
MKRLRAEYNKRRKEIRKRLKDFEDIHTKKDEDIFAELCFCILTPQSKAVNCDRAIKELKKRNLLLKGSEHDIRDRLKGLVRFHNKKAAYIVAARKALSKKNRVKVKSHLDKNDIFKTRKWLIKSIKGLGYKEASHFLRNIGLGKNISILDAHILKNLKKFGVIKEIPASVSGKNYTQVIEERMRKFAEKIKVPLEELDLLLWSCETGFVFK